MKFKCGSVFTEDLHESTSDADGKCRLAKLTTSALLTTAYGLTNNGALIVPNHDISYFLL